MYQPTSTCTQVRRARYMNLCTCTRYIETEFFTSLESRVFCMSNLSVLHTSMCTASNYRHVCPTHCITSNSARHTCMYMSCMSHVYYICAVYMTYIHDIHIDPDYYSTFKTTTNSRILRNRPMLNGSMLHRSIPETNKPKNSLIRHWDCNWLATKKQQQ